MTSHQMSSGLNNLKLPPPLTSTAPCRDISQSSMTVPDWMAVRRGDILLINSAVTVTYRHNCVTLLAARKPSRPRCNNQLNIYNIALSLSHSVYVININILNIEIKTEHISNVYISYKDWQED